MEKLPAEIKKYICGFLDLSTKNSMYKVNKFFFYYLQNYSQLVTNKRLEKYWVNINNQKHGKYKLYHTNSKLRLLCYYKNGGLNGRYNEYSIDGMLWVHCSYKDGQKHGYYLYASVSGSIRKFYQYNQLVKFDVEM